MEKSTNILTSHDVLSSSVRFFPQILGAEQSINISIADVNRTQGAFDTKFQQDLFTRERGFYDGSYYDTKLAQPIEDFSGEIYAGFRNSKGDFPIYEDEYFTNSRGEYYIGAKLSLLRNRDIDPRRFKRISAKLKVEAQRVKLTAIKLKTQEKALQSYWKWVAAGHIQKIYQHLLFLADNRQKKLVTRVENGDLAAIYLKENQQYIIKRQADLNLAEANFKEMSIGLSLYYRDDNAKRIVPTIKNLPKGMTSPSAFKTENVRLLVEKLKTRPEFSIFQNRKDLLSQQKKLARNDLLPFADLEVKAGKDQGRGSRTRREGEVIVQLNVTLPLQRSTAKADLQKAKAQLYELSYQEKMQLDILENSLEKLAVRLDNNYRFYHLVKKEAQLAVLMSQTEEERFVNGASDFFTLNQREENIATANIRLLKAQENYFKTLAKLYALTADFTKLGIVI